MLTVSGASSQSQYVLCVLEVGLDQCLHGYGGTSSPPLTLVSPNPRPVIQMLSGISSLSIQIDHSANTVFTLALDTQTYIKLTMADPPQGRARASTVSRALDSITQSSNCMFTCPTAREIVTDGATVDKDEIDRLRKRFMKLDKVSTQCAPCAQCVRC